MKRKHVLFGFATAVIAVAVTELVSIAFMLMTGQPVVRGPLLGERHSYDPFRGHRLNPEYRNQRDTGGEKIHSPDGFRENEAVPERKPAGEFRIFAMGGSALYGSPAGEPYPWHRSLRNDETIDFYLERLIAEDQAKRGAVVRVRVINAAVTAYQTFQHLVYLNQVLYAYQPDLVVFLDGHNDFYIARDGHNHWRDYSYSSVLWAESFNQARPALAVYALVRTLSTFSYFFTLLEGRLKQLDLFVRPVGYQPNPSLEPGPRLASAYGQVARDTFLRAYGQIRALGRQRGFDTIVFLQPEIIFEAPGRLSARDREMLSITARREPGAVIELRHNLRPLLPELFRAQELEFHDIGAIGSDPAGPDLYIDYCHLTPAGSLVVARRMLPAVLAAIARRQAMSGPRQAP